MIWKQVEPQEAISRLSVPSEIFSNTDTKCYINLRKLGAGNHIDYDAEHPILIIQANNQEPEWVTLYLYSFNFDQFAPQNEKISIEDWEKVVQGGVVQLTKNALQGLIEILLPVGSGFSQKLTRIVPYKVGDKSSLRITYEPLESSIVELGEYYVTQSLSETQKFLIHIFGDNKRVNILFTKFPETPHTIPYFSKLTKEAHQRLELDNKSISDLCLILKKYSAPPTIGGSRSCG